MKRRIDEITESEKVTVEGRLAAICRIALFRIVNKHHHLPDYADFRDVLRRPIQTEILKARLEEARLKPENEERIRQLIDQLAELSEENSGPDV